MNKKAKIKRIAALTCSEKWQENEETVAEVQRIAKTIWPKEKSGRKRPGRKIAIWHDDRILVTGTAEQLAEIEYRDDFQDWIADTTNYPIETIIRMIDGYEVEKEPLYYVKLPVAYLNHCDLETYLMKGDCGNITIADNNDFDNMKFTESEIKAIDERYWAFAVPVEER
ncbi:DUF1642 domain-containing protein [Enterococcus pernyi]|uniref:DUF1642 domain-containing protein n=1 Tax=Enterococcus pernyi TaxID=590158 RepID=UPI000A07A95C|nr:DUF1642 domain-containing protein [Enterococcus pernyi]